MYDDTPAAHIARGVNVGIGPCSLPNAYELMVLYQESDRLDELDPTFEENKDKGLGYKATNGRFNPNGSEAFWSSTSFSNTNSRTVNINGGVNSYYARTEVKGVLPIFEIKHLPVSYNPRKLTRHDNGKGSVLEFDMYGKKMKIFIPDAAYRPASLYAYGANGQNISELSNFTEDVNQVSNYPGDTTTPLRRILVDAELQMEFPSFRTDKTATENTDILMKYDTPAAHAAREVNVGIGACSLPNLYELLVLYQESDRIDDADPTVDSAIDRALGAKNLGGRFNPMNQYAYWSSTSYSDTEARRVNYTSLANYGARSYERGVLPIFELGYTPAYAQRKLTRHESNKGTVVEFDMYGKAMKMFVPDAAYRLTAKETWGMMNKNIPELTNFTEDVKALSNAIADTKPLVNILSDAELQAEFPSFRADKTATENTDILMKYDTPAAHACRDTDVGLGPMDLPNIYELMVMFQEADNLDAMDPTFNSNKDKGLGRTSTYGRFNLANCAAAWSSTSFNVHLALDLHSYGNVNCDHRGYSHGVIPVLEL